MSLASMAEAMPCYFWILTKHSASSCAQAGIPMPDPFAPKR